MKTGIITRLTVRLVAVAGLVVFSGCPSAGPGGGAGAGGGGGEATGGTAAGEDTNDVFAGQVSSLAGKPIAGAGVSLDDGRFTSTDDNGFYSFSGLPAGFRVADRLTCRSLSVPENVKEFPRVSILSGRDTFRDFVVVKSSSKILSAQRPATHPNPLPALPRLTPVEARECLVVVADRCPRESRPDWAPSSCCAPCQVQTRRAPHLRAFLSPPP